MSSKILNKNSKLGVTTRVIVCILMVVLVLFIPTGVVGDQPQNKINLADQLPKLQNDGHTLFESYYRGVNKTFMPDFSNPNDIRYKYWNDTESIESGHSLFKNISDLNPGLPSLYYEFVNSPQIVKSKLLQNVLRERTDPKDIWWNDFDNTVNAYTVLAQLGLVNKTISELNEMDNNSFDLFSYYSNVLNGTVVVNGTVVPAWTVITLKDLFVYRINQYLGSINVVLDGNNFAKLGVAVQEGLINLGNIGIQKLTNEMVNNANALNYATSVLTDTTNQKDFIKSYYTKRLTGNSDKPLSIDVPSLSSVIGNNYSTDLTGIFSPIEIQVKIDTLPNNLIQKKYADMGLIYYTNREIVNYTITTPNNHWAYDANGSLVYVYDNITTQQSYYRPAPGTWINDNTFVPYNPSQRGMFVWNDSIMNQPDTYNITLRLNSQSNSVSYPMEKASTDMTTYSKILPASNANKATIGLNIQQMEITQDYNNIIDQIFNQDTYNSLLQKTLIFDNTTYYFPNGTPTWNVKYAGGYQLDQNGAPVGGVNVTNDYLVNMSYDNTYGYNYTYLPINNVNFTVQVTIPDLIVENINAKTDGKNIFEKTDNTTNLLMQTIDRNDLTNIQGINQFSSTFVPNQVDSSSIALLIKDDILNDGFVNTTTDNSLVYSTTLSTDIYGNPIASLDQKSLEIRSVLMKTDYNYLKHITDSLNHPLEKKSYFLLELWYALLFGFIWFDLLSFASLLDSLFGFFASDL